MARADLVCAVLTDRNPNVYYELGIRHSLRRETIMIMEKAKEQKPPFDVQGYGILFYQDLEKRSNFEKFVNTLGEFINLAEQHKAANPVMDALPDEHSMAETVHIAIAARNTVVDIIKAALRSIRKEEFTVEGSISKALVQIKKLEDQWNKHGFKKQVSIVACDHVWENSKMLYHAQLKTVTKKSQHWWLDKTLRGEDKTVDIEAQPVEQVKSLFHDVILQQKGQGFRIASVWGRPDRLTVIAFDVVKMPDEVGHYIVVVEAHLLNRFQK